ncbi:hypothetical protein [Streptomyces sp. YIM S03343]
MQPVQSVAMIHMWDIDGKPGGDDDSKALSKPSLDCTDYEIYEVLRRHQGHRRGAGAVRSEEAPRPVLRHGEVQLHLPQPLKAAPCSY